ncbi:UDP-N-acetylglucosamine transferase subunit ALG13-like isoform X2 [Dendrobates tinctorius]|uniref:UDP-N-acetylglucosamine transferase subunit ALG13-like isoform X2 n=1 Tax=Dendrobates tinctorius TaxID=92724 RepID=UPI003CC95683
MNLLQSLQDEVSRPLPTQDDPYKFSEQVSSVIPTSCVNSAPATVISSSSAVGVPSTVTSTVLPQTAVQPIVVSQAPTGRPVTPGPGDMGDCTIPLPPPPYSCDPSGSDLPRDTKVLQYYFNLGLQCYHQSFWHPMVYVQQVPTPSHVEPYQGFPEPVPLVDQSVPAVYNDSRPVTLETGGHLVFILWLILLRRKHWFLIFRFIVALNWVARLGGIKIRYSFYCTEGCS